MTLYEMMTQRTDNYENLAKNDMENGYPKTASHCEGIAYGIRLVRDDLTIEQAESEYR